MSLVGHCKSGLYTRKEKQNKSTTVEYIYRFHATCILRAAT